MFFKPKTFNMNTNDSKEGTNRRGFLGTLAGSAAAIGIGTLAPSLDAFAGVKNFNTAVYGDPEEIFKKITGKHRVVFDATQPHEILPFAWPRVFLMTNEMTGTQNKDCSVMVVFRHSAIGYAMEDKLWAKYNFGEVFQANDPETNKPSTRNPFWKPKPGAFKVPGVGEVMIGIDQLQASGVIFCVCDVALTVYSAAVADGMKMKPEDVKKEWMEGLLPGIHVVPSGVWALGRAQQKQCAYIFAG
jgi:intracellular sulfur oxidation DsrE/DsrF family protein